MKTNKEILMKFVSTQGYKRNSPDKNRPMNVIPSGRITMQDVDFPVYGVDNMGNKQMMMPGGEYEFPGSYVVETPMYQVGGNNDIPANISVSNDLGNVYKNEYAKIVNHPSYIQRLQKEMYGDRKLNANEQKSLQEEYELRKKQLANAAVHVYNAPRTYYEEDMSTQPSTTRYDQGVSFKNDVHKAISGEGAAFHELSHVTENFGSYIPVESRNKSFAENGFLKTLQSNYKLPKVDSKLEKLYAEKEALYKNKLAEYLNSSDLDDSEKQRLLRTSSPLSLIKSRLSDKIPVDPETEALHQKIVEQETRANKAKGYFAEPTEIKARINDLRAKAHKYYNYDYNTEFDINKYPELLKDIQYLQLKHYLNMTPENVNKLSNYTAQVNSVGDGSMMQSGGQTEPRSFWQTASQFIPGYETYLDAKDIIQGAFTGNKAQMNQGVVGMGQPFAGKALTNTVDYITEKLLGKDTADYMSSKREGIVNMSDREKVALFQRYGPGGYDKWVKDGKPKLAYGGQNGGKVPFEEWYKTVPKYKNDTSTYNLRRAYELAPQSDLDAFVSDPDAHLYSVYQNPEGVYEFMKSKDHPTLNKELEWYNSNDPEAVQFRNAYNLDKSGKYYKYVPRKAAGGKIDEVYARSIQKNNGNSNVFVNAEHNTTFDGETSYQYNKQINDLNAKPYGVSYFGNTVTGNQMSTYGPNGANYFKVDPIMDNFLQNRSRLLSGEMYEHATGGEMIKRADGSYSRRGLWDNIRANKGSGKEPTKEMLEQERKIRMEHKQEGGTTGIDNAINEISNLIMQGDDPSDIYSMMLENGVEEDQAKDILEYAMERLQETDIEEEDVPMDDEEMAEYENNEEEENAEQEEMKRGGSIKINPAKKGTFKAQATKMGMSVQEAADYILRHREDYSPAMVKKANFAKNFARELGGEIYDLKEYKNGGGIPERYRKLGFTRVGAKRKSTRPGKKWMVLAKKGDQYKIVHGGWKGMQDYTQHHNKNRRERFWDRMGGRNSAKATDPFSPLYWHKRFGTWQEGGPITTTSNKLENLENNNFNKGLAFANTLGDPRNMMWALPNKGLLGAIKGVAGAAAGLSGAALGYEKLFAKNKQQAPTVTTTPPNSTQTPIAPAKISNGSGMGNMYFNQLQDEQQMSDLDAFHYTHGGMFYLPHAQFGGTGIITRTGGSGMGAMEYLDAKQQEEDSRVGITTQPVFSGQPADGTLPQKKRFTSTTYGDSAGQVAANNAIAGFGMLNSVLSARDNQKEYEQMMRRTGNTDNRYNAYNPTNPFGNYTLNAGPASNFALVTNTPIQDFGTSMAGAEYGGTAHYQEGGEYYLSDEDIKAILAMGGEIEFLD